MSAAAASRGTFFSSRWLESATAVSGVPTAALYRLVICSRCRWSARCASASRKGCSSGCRSKPVDGADEEAHCCFTCAAFFCAASWLSSFAMRDVCACTALLSSCTCAARSACEEPVASLSPLFLPQAAEAGASKQQSPKKADIFVICTRRRIRLLVGTAGQRPGTRRRLDNSLAISSLPTHSSHAVPLLSCSVALALIVPVARALHSACVPADVVRRARAVVGLVELPFALARPLSQPAHEQGRVPRCGCRCSGIRMKA